MAAEQKHPLSNQLMNGADIVVQVLADLGVDTVFGYSGGAILPTYDAIFRFGGDGQPSINLIVPANEQGAGFMASGYARASGRPGVALVTSGPGATNCVTPIRDCMADSIPVVLISGQVPTGSIGTDAFQEAPIINIMSACAKHVFLIKDIKILEQTIRSAFEIATSGRPGPVVIDIPKDLQTSETEFLGFGTLKLPGYQKRVEKMRANHLEQESCHQFFTFLGNSKRPLLYIGGGAIHSGAAPQISAFMERYQVPAVTTLMGIGSVDTTGQLSMHMLGMHGTAYANYAVEDCDLLIAVGARFDDRVAGCKEEFAPNAKVIMHIDIDSAEIGKIKAVDWSHHGDVATCLQKLMQHDEKFSGDFSKWHQHIAHLKEKYVLNYDRDSELIQPYYVLEELNKLVQGEAVVSTGVGQHQMWAAQYLDYKHARSWLTSGSMGTMGFGLPAAIGAQFACPDKVVFDIDGDGSLRMNIGELETVTTYKLPIKVLLLNNHGDGMVRQWQKLFFKNRFSASDKSLRRKDFVKTAKADGFVFAHRVDSKEDLIPALEAFVATDQPAFLEVVIDRDAGVYPMVSPGQSYKQMITGDYIASRPQPDRTGSSDDTPITSSEMF